MWNIKGSSGRFSVPCHVGAHCLGKMQAGMLEKTSVEVLVQQD